MENQHNNNPQVAAQQAQAQMIIEIVNAAGLDASNPKNQKAAAQVLNDVAQLQVPEREKERNALMREYGLNPDEFNGAIQSYNKRAEQLQSRAVALESQQEGLVSRFKRAGTIRSVVGLLGGLGTGYGVFQKWLKNNDKKWKKIGGTIGAFIAGTAVVSAIVGFFTTKPVHKEAQELDVQKTDLQNAHEKLAQEAQQYQYDAFRNLASRMLKERVEKKEAPAVEPPLEKAVKEDNTKSFTDKVGGEKAPADKVLEKDAPAISPDEIARQKDQAEKASPQVG